MHRARGRGLNPSSPLRAGPELDPRLLLQHRALGFGSAVVAALAVFFFSPAWLAGAARLVASYDVAAFCLLAAYWGVALKDDPQLTYRRAAIEDPGRNIVLGVVLVSCLAGLVSAVVILGHGPNVPPNDRSVALALGLAAVVLGWFLIHSSFILRYAHLFYIGDDAGATRRGLVFPGTTDPDDYDFAYFAFVIGMTGQVSDVQITDPDVRKVVMLHGLISFAYNTAILALVINLASGLLGNH